MSIRVARSTGWTGRYLGLVAMLLGALAFPAAAQQDTFDDRVGAITEIDAAAAGQETVGQISEAERHFRRGVDLYGRELFMEALGEFNRALALDPNFEEARAFRQRCEARLNIAATGQDPTERPQFDVFDPGMLAGEAVADGAPLTAEELKIRRVAELLHEGERHLEHQKYREAVEFFSQVLIIAPDNERAKKGLHASTIGLSQDDLRTAEQRLAEDRARIRLHIEQMKHLPEGADARGIRDYQYSVPVIEEEMVRVEERTVIEQALDSPVTLSFSGDHIDDIADFISQYLNINIVIDYRAVEPKELPAPPGQQPGPGVPAQQFGPAPGQFPQQQQEQAFGGLGQFGTVGTQQAQFTTERSSGVVSYISMRDVTLRQALRALLRPMNLDFTVQPGFIWISSPEFIRTETFEELETRYYELRNAGAETLFKILVTNVGGRAGQAGGFGGGGGGFGGGGFGGQQGFGGGGFGGQQGFGGGGFGGQQGGFGGGGFGGQQGGFGGGGFGGQQGGFGGGGFGGQQGFGGGGFGGQQGGFGGGGFGGGGGGGQFTNISQLFTTIDDRQVGETPAVIGLSQLSTGVGDAATGQFNGAGAGVFGAQAQPGIGTGAGVGAVDESGLSPILVILRNLMPEVREPNTGVLLSYMEFNPITNQLIVKNTPTNLSQLETHIRNLDVTPKQVSIESKFVRVATDRDRRLGFNWDANLTNIGNSQRPISDLGTSVTTPDGAPGREVDISGDGNLETIPFYTRPDGTSVFQNTVLDSVIGAALGSGGANEISAILTNNRDGNQLSVTLDYLDQMTESELLSSPRATTMNRKPVVIADISTQAVQTGSLINQQLASSGFGGGAVGFSSTQPIIENFIQGITLSVTPQISGDQIRLWLNPQVTSITGLSRQFVSRSTGVGGTTIEDTFSIPDTNTQSIWTNVIVRDGDTVVLGGSMRDASERTEQRVPYLADIPVLGRLFRGNSRITDQSSLLIFVTADIVDPTGSKMYDSGSELMTVF